MVINRVLRSGQAGQGPWKRLNETVERESTGDGVAHSNFYGVAALTR